LAILVNFSLIKDLIKTNKTKYKKEKKNTVWVKKATRDINFWSCSELKIRFSIKILVAISPKKEQTQLVILSGVFSKKLMIFFIKFILMKLKVGVF
jgi:hypothetical protein